MESYYLDSIHHPKTSDYIRWKSGKRVDTRLLILLEMFEEIYTKRHDLFKKIFHDQGNHEELFEKIKHAVKEKKMMKKAKSMPRSTSMRAIRNRGIDDNIDGLRLERFRIRTPNVIVEGSDNDDTSKSTSQGGQDQKGSK